MASMRSFCFLLFRSALVLFLCAGLATPGNLAAQQQQPAQTAGEQSEDVVRIRTELVQTDVTVLDKEGRFVDNLSRDQFELTVDGKPRPISFFDRIVAGSASEEAQIAAARGAASSGARGGTSAGISDRGRTIFFFADDFHLSPESVTRTRAMLARFVERELGQNDHAAIASASGQIGFLQQLTDNRAVLSAAIARLNTRSRAVRDGERPVMTEYQALKIEDYDRDAEGYFVDRILHDNPGIGREAAVNMVHSRARNMLTVGSSITKNTLGSLLGLVRNSEALPGRKILFFLSDGFFIDDRESDISHLLLRVAEAARRAGVVIYSIDSRGLISGLPDASTDVPFDLTGRLSRVNMGELSASQDGLNALAADTGGRMFLNSNALDAAVTRALAESSIYYLLAWRPEENERRGTKPHHVAVAIRDRHDLVVMTRRTFSEAAQEVADTGRAKRKKGGAPAAPVDELRETLLAAYESRALPVALELGYFQTPQDGLVLSVWAQAQPTVSEAEPAGSQDPAPIELAGMVLNDRGQAGASFRQQLKLVPAGGGSSSSVAFYSFELRLKPGLYQVRVAARDTRSGRTGSATQWIEIPDLKDGRLALGNLLLGGSTPTRAAGDPQPASLQPVTLSVDHRFLRSSRLRFITSIYNAAGGGTPPDLALQVQVFRNNQPVITAPLKKVSTEGVTDPARVPFAAEVSLEALPAGSYVLQVTAIDRKAKASAAQRTRFEIE